MNRLLLFFAILWSCSQLSAQWVETDWAAEYPFLKTEKNRLQFFGDSAAFMHFYQKLDTLIFAGKGEINIVHMGGSHVQAGTLSERMRQNWLHLSPDLKQARGFFFPYKLAQTNNPSDYSVTYDGYWEGCRCALPAADCSWGVSGINASTVDTNAAFTITAYDGDSGVYAFKTLRIFYLMNDTSFQLNPEFDATIRSVYRDTIAQFVEYHLSKPCTTFTFNLSQTHARQRGFTLQGIQYVDAKPGLTYHSLGVNGAATYSFLRCENFENQMAAIHPDLVIFGLGINDAYKPENQFSAEEYETNYDSLVAKIRSVNPDAVFIFMTNNDSYYKRRYSNPNITKVQLAMQHLSAKHQSAYWDLFEVMGGHNSIRTWERYGLAKSDKIHFTPAGYRLNADLLFEAIRQSYGQYLQLQYKKAH